MHYSEVWPFPLEATKSALKKVKLSVCLEQNYTAQFARLLRSEADYNVDHKINKYDGRQITPEEIIREVKKIFAQSLVSSAK